MGAGTGVLHNPVPIYPPANLEVVDLHFLWPAWKSITLLNGLENL